MATALVLGAGYFLCLSRLFHAQKAVKAFTFIDGSSS